MTGVHLTSAAQNPFTNIGAISGYGYGLIADTLPAVTWRVVPTKSRRVHLNP